MYLSILMGLMWLARLTRFDILFPVTYLASFNRPTQQDYEMLCRILKYLEVSANVAIRHLCRKVRFTAACDASHNVHKDHKGHGGLILHLGSGPIHTRSMKIRTVTLDTAESEGYMMCETVKYIIWGRELLKFWGHLILNATT